MRRLFLFVASLGVATMAVLGSSGGSAGAQSPDPIRPGNIFNGFVNGSLKDATVRMACAGPVRPGQLGHPAGGQTLTVSRGLDLLPSGFTGNAHHISADLKLRFPIPHAVHLADFFRYVTKPLPTSILVPCAGDGNVVFSPVNGGPKAVSETVHVQLVGLP